MLPAAVRADQRAVAVAQAPITSSTPIAPISGAVPTVLEFGARADGRSNDAQGIQAAIDAINLRGGGELRVPPGSYRIGSTVIVKSRVSVVADTGAVFLNTANLDLFRMKPSSRFDGGTVDVSGRGGAVFSSNAFTFDGSENSPRFRGVEPTVVRTRVVGRLGMGAGTAFLLKVQGDSARIYGAHIDASIDGMEVGVHLEKEGAKSDGWINGNDIRLRAIGTVDLVKMTTSNDGADIDGNYFRIEYQTVTAHSRSVVNLRGRYNVVEGMIWDFSSGKAVVCSPKSGLNMVLLGGLLEATLEDQGQSNTILPFTAARPGLKIAALIKNSTGLLPVDRMDVLLTNGNKIAWQDAGGATRPLIGLDSGDNLQIRTPPSSGSLVMSAATGHRTNIGGGERLRIDDDKNSGSTSMMLWDVSKGTLSRVTVGVPDSGGRGFKVLRVPN
ncbi:glycosyl hydrolase family 28-related protein [Ramlibacter agri]|uniref:glycosyl hydrolase family 28-related protein n=1 Tax=Ramlibacter agri TaxID=2728837 RepID=UPI00146F19AA|nr:glycosyl hydrolase family 28-related protein [Ramlibacter agri]